MLATVMHPGRAMKGLEALWWLWAVAAFALTYRAAKTYGDIKDPARRRLKELQGVAAERAKVKNTPVLMEVSQQDPVPKPRAVTAEPVQAALPEAPKPQPRSLAADMGKAPEVDKDDPYAHLLTT